VTQSRRPRSPGRPASAARTADPRDALLDAAKLAFARGGYAATSLKQIAHDAHVTPALASYYFGDKAGLLAAVIEQRVAPITGRVMAVLQESAPALERLQGFVREYTDMAVRHPWLPQLIVREVLNDQGVLRDTFVQRFAGGLGKQLLGTLSQAQAEGGLRAGLAPEHLAMSLLSLCIFPFIATPTVRDVLGVRVDEASAATLAAHHWSLFLAGAEVRP
jgi:TetR/AcrR family transcriptional regulator